MYRFVAPRAEHRGAQDLIAVGVRDDFHQPLRFTLFYGPFNASQGTLTAPDGAHAGARLTF